MSVTDSEGENNETGHYHNFPDLDEWFSHLGAEMVHCPFKHSLSHRLAWSVCISAHTFLT